MVGDGSRLVMAKRRRKAIDGLLSESLVVKIKCSGGGQ